MRPPLLARWALRILLPEEDATPSTHPVVVVSHRLWQTRFGGDPGLVGGEIRLNGRLYTVVGIAPEEFKGRIAPGIGTDFWAPIRMYPHLAPGQMGSVNLLITGRLRPGVSMAQARSVLDALATRFNEQRPDSRSELAIGAVNLAEIRLHPDLDGFITGVAALLFVAVGLLLLVACVNIAGFLLARATDRRKEMAVRVAMGAGRRDIVRQLLVESLLLATLGGAVGLVLGLGATRLLLSVDLPLDIPLNLDVGFNARLLLFTGLASALAAVLFGFTPALEATRAPVAATLRDESGSAGGRKKSGTRGIMVAAWASEMPEEEMTRFADDLLRNASESAGVRDVAVTGRMPLDLGNSTTSFEIPGVEPPPDQDRHTIQLTAASPGYLETMGIPIVEGRDFNPSDVEGSEQVAILTRAAAQRYWPGESALGRVLYRHGDTDDALTLAAALALLMACVGLYGMVRCAVARRTREMGIRLALGAERGTVVALMVRGGLALVAVGGLVGLLAALGLGRLLEGWLYGVGGTDPMVLLAAPALLGLVALAAAYLPARRVSRVNPVEALRSE